MTTTHIDESFHMQIYDIRTYLLWRDSNRALEREREERRLEKGRLTRRRGEARMPISKGEARIEKRGGLHKE